MAQQNEPLKMSYTVDQALSVTGLNRNAFYAAISRGELVTFKIGRRRMVSVRALQEFIERKEKEITAAVAA
ncbi:helix-turn-helix domain-containing protein [Pseudoxanthomonas sp. JBR18]|uniref:helix-turn-helix domain-containing protein n=1 Tax=Pseudoxanthomonas sp. JBR18 TaxID=2969308 RepID=UPI002305C286|nr:helix-turn-helix domain-containing protein [Pseudoxanthomonas sp. JBR18]WCE03160.1 helix-turn-helix domain-containing protein [Pseudoxanthomonas sp. JBR18]